MSVIRRILNSTKALVSNSLPTTGSNTFVGTQTYSGSIIPATNNTYDLGDVSKQFRHLYLSSGSLYIDGQKVLGSTGNELQITTDNGQSLKILEAGSDNIILQSADGNIELKTSGGGDVILDPTSGVIGVKGTMTIYGGNKILSSDGNAIQIGNDLGITGSITTTGNINGVNLSTLSSSLDTRIVTEKNRVDAILSAADADKDTFVEIVSLINSVDTSNDSTFASFYTASVGRLNNLETTSGSVNISVSNLNTFSGSALTRLSALEVETANLESFTSSINTTIKTRLNAETVVSGSSQITFSGISSLPTLVSGSSQITLSSTTGYGSVLNQAVLTSSTPTFTGVKGSSYFDAQANSGFRIRNATDTVNAGGFTRRGLWEGNANYDPAMWAETGYGLYFYSNGSGTARASFDTSGHFVPGANNTYNLGSASFRWANLYTNDLHLSNEDKVGGNDVDGTTGNWTIQEGQEHLYIINNKTGKKFKFSLEEIQ
jgi:hypothetical protein